MAPHVPSDLTTLIAALNAMNQVLGLNGRTLVGLLSSGIVVGEQAASYAHINSAGTFTLKGTSATLLSLNINSAAGTIYDSASAGTLAGTLIVGVISLSGTAPSEIPIGPQDRGLALNHGLVVVTTGTADITLGYL